jgi:hypothetical protein
VKLHREKMLTWIFRSNHKEHMKSENGFRFQSRDEEILNSIYQFGGILAKRQIKDIFWPGKSDRAMEKRLTKLHKEGYVNWPEKEDRKIHAVPEPICWLGWKGAVLLGQRYGLVIDHIACSNENQIRRLEIQLHRQGFHWLREPRWIQIRHDLVVVEFLMLLQKSLQKYPDLSLSEWIPEGAFRSHMDVIEYQEVLGKVIKKVKKGICPDAFFIIEDNNRKKLGQPYRARFLLEIDNNTHDNPSFGAEKSLPGGYYIQSPEYKQRFGQNSGRWLVVTTAGEKRMQNLLGQTEEKAGKNASLFLFSTYSKISISNLLQDKVWLQGGTKALISLV